MMNVFEHPWLLLTLAAMALIPATLIRRAKPEWGYLPLLAPVLLAALGFGLDHAVQTDSEKIHAIIRQCRQAAIEEDLPSLAVLICDDYDDGYHRSRNQMLASAERLLTGAAINKIRFQHLQLTLEARSGVVDLDTVMHLDPKSRYAAFGSVIFISLQIELIQQPDETWCIRRVGVTSVNNQPMNWGSIL